MIAATQRPMPAAAVKVSVVLGSYNRARFLKGTVASIREELARCPFRSEIIVVDGGSTDGSLAWLLKQKDILTIVQHNRGEWQGRAIERRSWGYFMNLAFKVAQGEYVCMLSDDCLAVPGAILNGVTLCDERRAAGERIGAAAFYWRDWPHEERYRVGLTFGGRMFVNHGLYLKEALEAVGYADEENYLFYHADGDLCLRMWQAGYPCIDAPDSYVEHHAHANVSVRDSNAAVQKGDWERYVQTWGSLGVPQQDWLVREYRDPARTVRKFPRAWFGGRS
ncbi:glycosyltransferase [Geomonas paludis]|uniref:Glycosyltransferase n=1 Tax=Geomonas paludis TaxID=2740185 RepID=A0A6V8MX11_9BACT|nr:glycosyltransferase [Geomonas paludis]UPU34379.1 glycosyltransferase [Geomonas paludis]GFO64364.1 hypothetical protein GMPD_22830 [Geomonas paludis]